MFVIIQMCFHFNLLFAVFVQLHLDSYQFAISDCESPSSIYAGNDYPFFFNKKNIKKPNLQTYSCNSQKGK